VFFLADSLLSGGVVEWWEWWSGGVVGVPFEWLAKKVFGAGFRDSLNREKSLSETILSSPEDL